MNFPNSHLTPIVKCEAADLMSGKLHGFRLVLLYDLVSRDLIHVFIRRWYTMHSGGSRMWKIRTENFECYMPKLNAQRNGRTKNISRWLLFSIVRHHSAQCTWIKRNSGKMQRNASVLKHRHISRAHTFTYITMEEFPFVIYYDFTKKTDE